MKKTLLTCLLTGLTAISAQVSADNLIAEKALNERLHPSATTIFSTTVDLGEAQPIRAVGVLTDWWRKRPTEIRVYDNSTGTKGEMIGYAHFPNYLNAICGEHFNETCRYPENPVGRLTVKSRGYVSSVVVEAHGLLDAANEYAYFSGVQVLGRSTGRSDTDVARLSQGSNASDSVLAAIAVLENESVQNETGTSAYVSQINIGLSSDYRNYLIDLHYQIIDSPVKKCVRAKTQYSDYPNGVEKIVEVVGNDC